MRALLLLLLLPGLAAAQSAGDLVINEIMIRSVTAPEWVELLNTTSGDLLLDGCTLHDGDATVALDGVTVPADGYAVLSDDDSLCVAFEDAAGSTCAHPSEGTFASFSFSDGTSDTVTIDCGGTVIDTVTFDWSQLQGDCSGSTCAANLDPATPTAAANDDWPGAWCVPPQSAFVYDTLGREMLATPGAENVCATAADTCGAGDVVFTELMLAPPSSTREWFELKVLAPEGCDLHDCELREGPFPDPSFEPTNEEWAVHVIDAPGNSLPLGSGDYALFARGAEQVVGDEDTAPDASWIYADYQYSTISFGNSEAAFVHLSCGGVALDSVPYDWTRFSASCADGGCSVNLLPGREDAVTNDSVDAFCLAPDEPTYIASSGDPFTGTPGQPGACLQRSWPGPGQVIFTEVQGLPNSGEEDSLPEWFELTHLGGATVELTGCRILRSRLDPVTGEYTPTSTSSEATFGQNTDGAVMAEGDVVVWSGSGRCLDGTERELQSCATDELAFGGISFSNSESERLELFCPDGASGEVLVDAMAYDFTQQGIRDGHSVEFDPTGDAPGSNNDELGAWCEAGFGDCYVTNDLEQCSYGTPFVAGPCAAENTNFPQSGVPGCRCQAVAPAGGAWAVLALFGLLARRRRERA